MISNNASFSVPRRRFLSLAAAGTLAGRMTGAQAHASAGEVDPPLAAPRVQLRTHDGRSLPAAELLRGRVTALQLMFTGCSATCPIQGALFAELQGRMLQDGGAEAGHLQLMSASIDPLGDDPRALAQWLHRFGGGKRWLAAVPALQDLDTWVDGLQGRRVGVDRHTTQVFLFDRQARLVLRTVDFPPPPAVLAAMQAVARRGGT